MKRNIWKSMTNGDLHRTSQEELGVKQVFAHEHPQRSSAGFTLIELLVVLAILGIISAIALPQYASYKAQAYDSRAQSDLRSVAIAEEAYFITSEQYLSCDGDSCTELPGIATLSDGVLLSITATATGFTGEARHERGSGKQFRWNSRQGGMTN